MICPNCQKEVADNSTFCNHCGAQCTLICPNCGKEVSGTSSFCNHCGAKCDAAAKEEMLQELYTLARESYQAEGDNRWIDYYRKINEIDKDSWEAFLYTASVDIPKLWADEPGEIILKMHDLIYTVFNKAKEHPNDATMDEVIDTIYQRIDLFLYAERIKVDIEIRRGINSLTSITIQRVVLAEEGLRSAIAACAAEGGNKEKALATYKTAIEKLYEYPELLHDRDLKERVDKSIQDILEKAREIDPDFLAPEPPKNKEMAQSEVPVSAKTEPIPEATSGKCRNCGADISEGTLCDKCLKSLDQEMLTVEERKKKNSMQDTWGCIFGIIGTIAIIYGIIWVFAEFWKAFPWLVIGIVCLVLCFKNQGSVCEECQRRGTLEQINETLVNTKDTYVKEKQKFTQTRKDGSIVVTPSRENVWETEVNVPATQYTYEITYKCRKCGNIQFDHKTRTEKK